MGISFRGPPVGSLADASRPPSVQRLGENPPPAAIPQRLGCREAALVDVHLDRPSAGPG